MSKVSSKGQLMSNLQKAHLISWIVPIMRCSVILPPSFFFPPKITIFNTRYMLSLETGMSNLSLLFLFVLRWLSHLILGEIPLILTSMEQTAGIGVACPH